MFWNTGAVPTGFMIATSVTTAWTKSDFTGRC